VSQVNSWIKGGNEATVVTEPTFYRVEPTKDADTRAARCTPTGYFKKKKKL
jgi:hypothetical protein